MPALKPATIGQKFLTDCGQNRPLTTIKDTELIYAEMLDIAGNDPEKILDEVIDVIKMKQV